MRYFQTILKVSVFACFLVLVIFGRSISTTMFWLLYNISVSYYLTNLYLWIERKITRKRMCALGWHKEDIRHIHKDESGYFLVLHVGCSLCGKLTRSVPLPIPDLTDTKYRK